ncbi:MAG: 8-amino-7-oxononanoate synthase [Bacteroidetes bacterium]|nr:8-amino-7-oxononanoate synthase [Bacteroidota bacterium]
MAPVEERIVAALDERRKTNSLRKLIPFDHSLIDFSSNDYLGLARSAEFRNYVEEKGKSLGSAQLFGSGGSRLLSGDSEFIEKTENFFAQHFRSGSGLIFNSGFAANCGIFGCVPQKGDTVLYDELIHASVRDGIRLSNARAWSFRHNDVDHLRELMDRAEGNIFVAVESFYSMDGDSCPLEEMVELCEEKNASLILDEAHSTGLAGKNGEGLAVETGLHEKIFARLYTFGKAMGCHGAFVACSTVLREYLVNFSRPFIFTTALPVHDIHVMRCAVEFVSAQSELRDLLRKNIFHFSEEASRCFPGHVRSGSAIQSMIIPGNENVKAVMEKCREKKLDVRAILSPTVAEGKERLRIILHSFNSKEDIGLLIQHLSA